MPRPLGTADERRAERAGYLNALRGLVANTDAIESSLGRVRRAANGDSDEELYRFARLIIMSEGGPSDWRQARLKRIRNREDALEEIAMSMDHSWLAAETEEDVFMDELRNEVIQAYPNPDRAGCPDESALRRVVFREINEYPDSDAVMQHTMTCGPCTQSSDTKHPSELKQLRRREVCRMQDLPAVISGKWMLKRPELRALASKLGILEGVREGITWDVLVVGA